VARFYERINDVSLRTDGPVAEQQPTDRDER
jgi:hypothetical protein